METWGGAAFPTTDQKASGLYKALEQDW